MGRRRSVQLNVRLSESLAARFHTVASDFEQPKVRIIEQLVRAFTEMDQVQRENLVLRPALDPPSFVEHAWRIVGPDAMRRGDIALYEVIFRLAHAAGEGGITGMHNAIDEGRTGQSEPITGVFSVALAQLTSSRVAYGALKSEVVFGLIRLAESGMTLPAAVERLRTVTVPPRKPPRASP